MQPNTARVLPIVQLISEIVMAAGYLLGLIPFVYLWSAGWVIPLAVLNVVLAALTRNGTLAVTGVNLVASVLSLIPVLGYATRLLGAALNAYSVMKLRKRL